MHSAKRFSPPTRSALRLASIYALIAVSWTAVSEWMLTALVHDPVWLTTLQAINRGGFILVTAILLGVFVRRNLAKTGLAEQRAQLLAENTGDLILVYTLDRRLAYANAACEVLTGYSVAELHTLALDAYLHPQDHELMLARFEAAFKGGSGENVELRIITKEGQVKWVQASWRPLRDVDGRMLGVQVSQRDITTRKEIEERLHQMQARLVQSEKLATLGRLVSDVAHELNNPLTSILGHAQLLLQTDLAPEERADVQVIETHAQRASHIIINLLSFARQRAPERLQVDINAIVSRTLELRTYRLRTQNVQVDLRLAADLPLILANPFQIQQVVLNLLINAEQALTDPIWRTHTLQPARLVIETAHQPASGDLPEMIIARIRDTGPGISPEVRERIFEPFFTTKDQGTGLGLSIASSIMHDHGGYIRFESQPGAGTTAEMYLPVTSMLVPSSCDAPRITGDTLLPLAGTRILVVDDESSIREFLARTLARYGVQVDTVADGCVALQFLQQGDYDLVICDLVMPGMSGRVLYDSLTQHMPDLNRRIIFITGDSVNVETATFLATSGCHYLIKPFDIQELLGITGTLIAASKQKAAHLSFDILPR